MSMNLPPTIELFGITAKFNHQGAGLLDVTSFRDVVIVGGFLMYICLPACMIVRVVISLYFAVANILA